MAYGQGLKIHTTIAKAEAALTLLYQERDKQLKQCLENGYCPNCATKAKPQKMTDELKAQGAWFEKCQKCQTDFVVKVTG